MFTNFVLLISRVICRGNSQLLEYSRLPDLDHPGLAPHWSVHYLSPSLTIYGPAHQLILSPTLPLLTGRNLESHIAANGPNVTFHYLYFNYFVLNITLPLLSSTISRLMGLAPCHQELEPSSSSVPCLAQLSNTIGVTSTLQTVVIQYEARSLIMPLRPTKCDAQLLTPFMLLAL